jgi:hypothetical protein
MGIKNYNAPNLFIPCVMVSMRYALMLVCIA